MDNKIIKSTEELLSMDDGDEGDEQLDHWYHKRSWVFVQPLPLALTGIQGITLDNTVFMMGKLPSSIYNYSQSGILCRRQGGVSGEGHHEAHVS